jgi:ATP-dependent Lon protease
MTTKPESDTSSEAPVEKVEILPVLPLPEVVIFPNSISPLFVVRAPSIAAVEQATSDRDRIFLVTQKTTDPDIPKPKDLYEVGTISQILQVQRLPDNSMRIFIEGLTVARVLHYFTPGNAINAHVEPIQHHIPRQTKHLQALRRAVVNQFETYSRLSDKIPEDLFLNIKNLEDPLALCHAIGNYAAFKSTDKQTLLEEENVDEKLLFLSRIFSSENELLAMEGKILSQVKNQIGKNQKEYFLNEQLKVIEKELGLVNDDDVELEELQTAIDESLMSQEARDKALRELNRLSRMAPMSPESTVSRTYIEWLLDYPWRVYTKDKLEMRRAALVLNEDHYGLEKVKERILEYLAVLRLVKDSMHGPILCLVGPPGVGKTVWPGPSPGPSTASSSASPSAACATKRKSADTAEPTSAPCPARSFNSSRRPSRPIPSCSSTRLTR